MNTRTRQYLHGLIFAMGLVLIVGGIVTKTYGASIVGLIVAAVDFHQCQEWNKQRSADDKKAHQKEAEK